MKRLLFLLILLPFLTAAQNYQCLQSGPCRYFMSGENYLRGIRIDSIRTIGGNTVFYPFRSIRGRYPATLDHDGGSWLGKKVIQLADGTFLFDNIWNDTVVIKTQAHIGDSWVFFRDTTSRYYEATVTSADTLSFWGITDSVKTITILAYDAAGPVPADPVNNFQLKLSKNNGFAQVFDLYTFPYHAPDSAYINGFDYYLDVIIGATFSSSVNASNSVFSAISLVNPLHSQLYDWNVGDVFECSTFKWGIPTEGWYPYSYYFDSITDKTVSPDGVDFSYSGWEAHEVFPLFVPINRYSGYPMTVQYTSGTFHQANFLLIDTSVMPEEHNQQFLEYYYPDDTEYCMHSCLYKFIQPLFGAFNEGSPLHITHKLGLGLVYYDVNVFSGDPPYDLDTTLIYSRKSGITCGGYYNDPLGIPTVASQNILQVYPDPVASLLTITASAKIEQVNIINLLGQTIFSNNYNSKEVQINVANLPSGVYFVKVNGGEVRRFVKE